MAEYATREAEVRTTAVANPAPLGLSAFALTTFVLSAANAGLYTGGAIVIGLALFYGGLAQLCAGMWEFRTGNIFGATAFSSYGAFWMAVGFSLLPLFGGKNIVELAGGATALGVFFLGWTIFTALMFIGTLRTDGALIAVFGFLALTFLFLTIGALGGASGMTTVGGWLGIVTAALAWYRALALLLGGSTSAFKLPIFPMA